MAQYGSINIRFTATKESFDRALTQIGSAVNRFGQQASKAFQKVTQDTARLNAEASKTPGILDKTTKELKEFRRAAEGVYFAGLHLTYIGAALTGMAFLPIKAAADFERSMSKVLAVTDGAAERFRDLQNTASELGRTTKFTATQVADGLAFLGLAGFSAAESIQAIGPALNLAAAGGIDLATSADIASNVLQAMRLPVHRLTQVTDTLANTAASSNTNILQLAEALKYAAPPAAAAGIAVEQLSALLGTLGNAGIQASLAGTSLRAILASLAKPSKEARETMQRLGVTVASTADGSIDLVKTLEDLGRAQLTLADANAIFQRRGAAAALTLAQQIGTVKELTIANELSAGAAQYMATTMEDNVIGAFIRVTSAADGLARAFADPLLPILKDLLLWIAETTTSLAQFADEHAIIAGTVTALAGSLGILITVLGLTALSVGAVQRAWALLVDLGLLNWLAALRVNLIAANYSLFQMAARSLIAGAGLNFMSVALTGLTRGLLLFFKLLIANPFVAVGAAILAIVLYLKNWKAKQKELTEELKGTAFAAQEAVGSFDELQDAIDRSIDGSKEQADASKRLRENLVKYAKENENLAAVALAAALAIDEETGAINDVNGALTTFFKKLDDKRLEAMGDHLTNMGGGLKNLDDNFITMSSTLARLKTEALGVSRIMLYLSSLGTINFDPYGPAAERAKELKNETELLRLQSQKYFQSLFADKKLDANLTYEQLAAWVDLIYKQDEYKDKVVQGIFDAKEAFIAAQKAQKDVAGKTTEERAVIFRNEVTAQLKGLDDLIEKYEVLREVATDASSIAFTQGLYAEAEEKTDDYIAALQNASKATADVARETREQIKKKISLDESLLNFDKDTGARKRIIAELAYYQTIYNARAKDYKDTLNKLGEKNRATIQLNELLAEDEKALSDKRTQLSEHDLMIYNKNAKLRDRLRTQIEKERIKAMEDGVGKAAATYDQEVQEFLRSREYMAAKTTGHTELVTGMLQAIWERYIKRRDDALRKAVKEDVQIRVALHDASVQKAKDAMEELMIELEGAVEQGKATDLQLIEAKRIDDIKLANAELVKLRLQLKALDVDRKEDKDSIIKINADIESAEASIRKINKTAIVETEKANYEIEQEKLAHTQRVNAILQDTLGEGKLKERYALELEAMKASHAAQLEELKRQGTVTADEKKRIKQIEAALGAEYAAKELERDRALMDQKLQLWQMAAGSIKGMAADMFTAVGQESKAWFNIQRAAAAAEAIINGAVAVTKAYRDAPNMYIAAMQAALIGGRVGAQLAVINAQQYPAKAEGGELPGKSPHKKADNLLFRGTAGEWVMPVDAVKYFGKSFMRDVQNQVTPMELMGSLIDRNFKKIKIPESVKTTSKITEKDRAYTNKLSRFIQAIRVKKESRDITQRSEVSESNLLSKLIERDRHKTVNNSITKLIELYSSSKEKIGPPITTVTKLTEKEREHTDTSSRLIKSTILKTESRGGTAHSIPSKPIERDPHTIIKNNISKLIERISVSKLIERDKHRTVRDSISKLIELYTIVKEKLAVPVAAYAGGGQLGGRSPHPKADNLLFRGTAGEHVMSNASVGHYGRAFMQAVNERKFPLALSRTISNVYHQERITRGYAAGGQIDARSAQGGGTVNNISLPIAVNLPANLGGIQRRLESEIEPIVLRIIQEEIGY